MSEWTIYDIREASSEELEEAFGEPSRTVILADLGRELYEVLWELKATLPETFLSRADKAGLDTGWIRTPLKYAQVVCDRYEREVGDE